MYMKYIIQGETSYYVVTSINTNETDVVFNKI